MNKEKVFCSECKFVRTTLSNPTCTQKKSFTSPDTFYKRSTTEYTQLIPDVENRNNDCKYYEPR